jgi:hypothetical protein
MNSPQTLSPDVQEALDRVSALVQKALVRMPPDGGTKKADQQAGEAA